MPKQRTILDKMYELGTSTGMKCRYCAQQCSLHIDISIDECEKRRKGIFEVA